MLRGNVETLQFGDCDVQSPIFDILKNKAFVAFETDSDWVSAPVSFVGLTSQGTWADVYTEDGTALYVTGTIAAGARVPVKINTLLGLNSVKLQSGTTASPVKQTAGPVVTAVFADFN